LTLAERRVLGVLVEKAKTTPDAYPMSVNALVTGCNQKSNRDPLLELSDEEVEEVLAGLQKKGLAIKITGGRVVRWRHALYEAWKVDKVEIAALAELLLRGPQTEGELRGRASRMEPIDDLDALRPVLRTLAEQKLVVYLTPEGRRGTVLTHGFHAPEELERLKVKHHADAEAAAPAAVGPVSAARPVPPEVERRLDELRTDFTALQATVADLQRALAALTEQVRAVREGLGM
jgi:uncharacterized protein YceH (UPF0502 family)